jgi:REP element-mobilizing transposase RayT
MPDHVHLVTGRPDMKVEQTVIQFKGAATEHLVADEIHPFMDERDEKGRRPKCFARGEWKVFLDPENVDRAIRYVENNPIKEGRPKQNWSFVVPWTG